VIELVNQWRLGFQPAKLTRAKLADTILALQLGKWHRVFIAKSAPIDRHPIRRFNTAMQAEHGVSSHWRMVMGYEYKTNGASTTRQLQPVLIQRF
jgi:hypothetical protein